MIISFSYKYHHTFLFTKTTQSKLIKTSMADDEKTQGGVKAGKGAEGSKDAERAPVGGLELKSVTFDLQVPNLRNGSLANIQQAAVRAGMQALYYWPTIKELPAESAVDAAQHSFRAHNVSLMMGYGESITAAQEVDCRKWAVVLAGVRAGAQAAWRLTVADVTKKEVFNSGMRAVGGRIVMDAEGGTAGPKWAAAQSLTALSQVEMDVLAMCAYMGMAVPILQGASLIMTGHHYIPSTYKQFAGLKRQALGIANKDVEAWVTSLGERFDDLAFHKACHPISPDLKRELAAHKDVALKLSASGHGSVSIRLPAIPSEATGGKAALALVRAASRVIEEMGDKISMEKGVQLMMDLESAARGAPRSEACDKVVKWVQDNERTLAFCAGIVQQIHDMSGSGKNTLLSAYSVKKLMASNPAEVSKGVTYARASNTRTREKMERGEYKLGVTEL